MLIVQKLTESFTPLIGTKCLWVPNGSNEYIQFVFGDVYISATACEFRKDRKSFTKKISWLNTSNDYSHLKFY